MSIIQTLVSLHQMFHTKFCWFIHTITGSIHLSKYLLQMFRLEKRRLSSKERNTAWSKMFWWFFSRIMTNRRKHVYAQKEHTHRSASKNKSLEVRSHFKISMFKIKRQNMSSSRCRRWRHLSVSLSLNGRVAASVTVTAAGRYSAIRRPSE